MMLIFSKKASTSGDNAVLGRLRIERHVTGFAPPVVWRQCIPVRHGGSVGWCASFLGTRGTSHEAMIGLELCLNTTIFRLLPHVCGEVKCAFALLCAPRVSSASTNASRGRARSRQTFASSADSTYSPRTAVGPLSPQLAVELWLRGNITVGNITAVITR